MDCPSALATFRAMLRALRKTSGAMTALPKFMTTPPFMFLMISAYFRKSAYEAAPEAAPSKLGCSWIMSYPIPIWTVAGMPRRWQAAKTLISL